MGRSATDDDVGVRDERPPGVRQADVAGHRVTLIERDATPFNTNKGEPAKIGCFLENLVSEANEGAVNLRRAHQLFLFSYDCHANWREALLSRQSITRFPVGWTGSF